MKRRRKLKPVKREELAPIYMTARHGERDYPVVIDGNRVMRWVGFGWVDEGPVRAIDYQRYPEVID